MEKETEQLVREAPRKSGLATSFGTIFAIIFCLGFGIALSYAAATNWNKSCDQPLRLFLMGFGGTGVIAGLIFLVLEMTSKGSDEEDGLPTTVTIWGIILVFFAFGITGSMFYWDTEDCDVLAAVAHRWTFAGVLAFLILASLLASSVLGKFGGPMFALFGYGLANLFKFLSDLFKGLADALNDSGDPENQPAKRSAAAEFALYVNHATLMWFFAYILMQVHEERNDPCDTPLHQCLVAFAVYGIVMTYFDFLYEKFAGIKTKEKLKPYFRYVLIINIVAYIIWGIFTLTQVFGSKTCKDTAKDVYRLAFLLSCLFLIFCGILLLGLCAGLLDFLCSGKLRFVVVVETGDGEEDEFQR